LQADIAASSPTPSHRATTPKQIRSGNTQQRDTKNAAPATTTSNTHHQIPQGGATANISKSHHDSLHNLQFSQHGHQQNMQPIDYVPIPQISQNFSANPSNYDIVGMPAVIQQRMSLNSSVHSLANSHQRIEQPSSACAVNNFYLQNNMPAAENAPRVPVSSSLGGPPSAGNNDQRQAGQESIAAANSSGATASLAGNLCSLSKLQQLTNCLESQPCNTSPGAQVNLAPSPHHPIPPNSMTPPPHLLMQNLQQRPSRNLCPRLQLHLHAIRKKKLRKPLSLSLMKFHRGHQKWIGSKKSRILCPIYHQTVLRFLPFRTNQFLSQ